MKETNKVSQWRTVVGQGCGRSGLLSLGCQQATTMATLTCSTDIRPDPSLDFWAVVTDLIFTNPYTDAIIIPISQMGLSKALGVHCGNLVMGEGSQLVPNGQFVIQNLACYFLTVKVELSPSFVNSLDIAGGLT